MNVVKCTNGHFFDGDAYSMCPHCGASVGAQKTAAHISEAKQPRVGLLGKLMEKSKTGQQIRYEESRHENEVFNHNGHSSTGRSVTGIMNAEPNQIVPIQNSDRDLTLDFWQNTNNNSAVNPDDEKNKTVIDKADTSKDCYETYKNKEVNVNQQPSLSETVKKASANTEGKTMSYFSSMTEKYEDNSVNQQVMTDPVVGWLVSVSGKHFGQSFGIVAGKNTIGRNSENQIILNLDNAVSRSKHTIITYEPKKRVFYIQPGDSSGLTYLNNEYITEVKQLQKRDLIEIGETKLTFIPLCGDDFTWEEFISKE